MRYCAFNSDLFGIYRILRLLQDVISNPLVLELDFLAFRLTKLNASDLEQNSLGKNLVQSLL
jgi:hypothetical protein